MKHLFSSVRFVQLVICAFCLMTGCSAKSVRGKEDAIISAKQEMILRGWKGIEVENARLENGRWIITLWSLPETVGGHATVEVSTEGKVLRVIPGL